MMTIDGFISGKVWGKIHWMLTVLVVRLLVAGCGQAGEKEGSSAVEAATTTGKVTGSVIPSCVTLPGKNIYK